MYYTSGIHLLQTNQCQNILRYTSTRDFQALETVFGIWIIFWLYSLVTWVRDSRHYVPRFEARTSIIIKPAILEHETKIRRPLLSAIDFFYQNLTSFVFTMPPERNIKTNPSKLPRPSASSRRSARASSAESTNSNDSDPFASPPTQTTGTTSSKSTKPSNKRISIIIEDEEEPKATIPPELLTKILHEFFQQEGTRMSKDAGLAIGKYMETFVREAIARASFERQQAEGETGDNFLEVSLCWFVSHRIEDRGMRERSNVHFQVEDLEKLAPQLLLDFWRRNIVIADGEGASSGKARMSHIGCIRGYDHEMMIDRVDALD